MLPHLHRYYAGFPSFLMFLDIVFFGIDAENEVKMTWKYSDFLYVNCKRAHGNVNSKMHALSYGLISQAGHIFLVV